MEESTEDNPEETTEDAGETPKRPRRPWPVVLAVALVFAGLGAWFTAEANALRAKEFDAPAAAEVTASVTISLNRIFSYGYDHTEVTEHAAANVLRGPALAAYQRLFGQVRQLAPPQHLVLTTRVVDSAVETLTGDRAVLLVFLDQSAVRGDGIPTAAASQLAVTAERTGPAWFITGMVPR